MRDIADELGACAFGSPQHVPHSGEGLAQGTDLIPPPCRQGVIVIACAQPLGSHCELIDRSREPSGEDQAEQSRSDGRQPGRQQEPGAQVIEHRSDIAEWMGQRQSAYEDPFSMKRKRQGQPVTFFAVQ